MAGDILMLDGYLWRLNEAGIGEMQAECLGAAVSCEGMDGAIAHLPSRKWRRAAR